MSWWKFWEKEERPTINRQTLRELLRNALEFDYIYEPYMADKAYIIPNESKVLRALSRFNPGPYVLNLNDCDNTAHAFANRFPGQTVGTVYVKTAGKVPHALNFYLNEEHEIILMDARSKNIYFDLSDFKAFRGECI